MGIQSHSHAHLYIRVRVLASTGVGVQWNNLRHPINDDNQFSMSDVYIMLSVNVAIHSLVFWYLDGLRPGDFGMPKPVYFPFTVLARHFLALFRAV